MSYVKHLQYLCINHKAICELFDLLSYGLKPVSKYQDVLTSLLRITVALSVTLVEPFNRLMGEEGSGSG